MVQCAVKPFPYTYLGLPLGLRKPIAAQLQGVVDGAARRLPAWGARMMNRGGRSTLVRTTLTTVPVHAMLLLDLSAKTLDELLGICRGFMWKGRKDVKGGHCVMAWNKVASPKEVRGIGIPNLKLLNLALICRWAWLHRTEPSQPWMALNIQIPWASRAIFEAATTMELGKGASALFWSDRWYRNQKMEEVAPHLLQMVPHEDGQRWNTGWGVGEGLWSQSQC